MFKFVRVLWSLAGAAVLFSLLPAKAWALCVCVDCTYERCVEFCGRTGQAHFCTYVPPVPPPPPPEPPKKKPADMGVSVNAVLSEVNWQNNRLFATYTATLTNNGQEKAENVQMTARLPKVLMAQSVSNTSCVMPGNTLGQPAVTTGATPLGGQVRCQWAERDAGSSTQVRIVLRIVDATDFHSLQAGESLQNFLSDPKGVEFEVTSKSDAEAGNNKKLVNDLAIPFVGGSNDGTRLAMEAIAPYFTYDTDEYSKTCNFYKLDIYDRLEKIRMLHPEAFANLSYGGITSGDYQVPITGGTAGHVGVVVYVRGTNYRQTGIIIHGTPSPSPLTLYSPFYETQIGTNPIESQIGVLGWTAINGLYNRTPAHLFPGKPQQEGNGGFEGQYADNGAEFTLDGQAAPVVQAPLPMSCPMAPDAVVITTESPVEIIATNRSGQRIRTQDGKLVDQGLATGITSMAFPHADGTFGWTLVLPRDHYDVQLVGTRTGTYKLIMTTFNDQGEPVRVVTEGTTAPGKTETYALAGAPPGSTPPAAAGGGTQATTGSAGGGGATGLLSVLALVSMLASLRRGRRTLH